MKQISFDNIKGILSNDELRQVKGGELSFASEGEHKCCWDNDTSNCSTCNEYQSCVSGAHLQDC